jgi:hypothetical protein
MPRSGITRLITSVALLSATACFPYGFAGGGLPSHIRTVAVLPFENDTPSAELQREVYDALRKGMQSRLGLREAPESKADALVKGTILRYDVDVPISYSADPRQVTSTRRRLQIAIDIQIVDQTTSKVLWERKGLQVDGDYAERAEVAGRKQALDKLINDVIEGAQSQW